MPLFVRPDSVSLITQMFNLFYLFTYPPMQQKCWYTVLLMLGDGTDSAKREAECSVGVFPHTCICLRWRSCVGHLRLNLKTTNWTKDTTPKSCHYLMLLLLCDSLFPLDNNNVKGVSVSSLVLHHSGLRAAHSSIKSEWWMEVLLSFIKSATRIKFPDQIL